MKREEIIRRHKINHDQFFDYVASLNEADYNFRFNNEKWDAGQQLDHMTRTIGAFAMAMELPKFLLKYKFGKANRPSRNFEEIVDRYRKGIAGGYKASGRFVPKELLFKDRDKRLKKLVKKARRIESKIGKYSETDLDNYVIPHPAFKIMTVREFMYFAIYHVDDHLSQIKRNLSWREN